MSELTRKCSDCNGRGTISPTPSALIGEIAPQRCPYCDGTGKVATYAARVSEQVPERVGFMQVGPGGICFAHGPYKGNECPQWLKGQWQSPCITDPIKPEYVKMSQEQTRQTNKIYTQAQLEAAVAEKEHEVEQIRRFMEHFIVKIEPFYEKKHGKLPPLESGTWELLAFVQNQLTTQTEAVAKVRSETWNDAIATVRGLLQSSQVGKLRDVIIEALTAAEAGGGK